MYQKSHFVVKVAIPSENYNYIGKKLIIFYDSFLGRNPLNFSFSKYCIFFQSYSYLQKLSKVPLQGYEEASNQ